MIAMFGSALDVVIAVLFGTVKTVAKIAVVLTILSVLTLILLITGASHLIQ